MDHIAVEKKWKKIWQDTNEDKFDPSKVDNKYYVLEMFSYPSGSNLHLGHWFNFAPADSFARYKKMCGYEVFQPMGFDAFGLPAENYAIKTGIHPQDSTLKNIATMERQLKDIGAMFSWDNEVITCLPDYYKWTQWIFVQLFKHGLAYRKESPVNWCTSCNTVIANEQVVDGKCERCGGEVTHKDMMQWCLKITDYAEELLSGLDGLDWPEKTKTMQKNWIGKSVGGEVSFPLEKGKEKITVFTTRADTLMGVSYVVLAPEHPLVMKIVTDEYLSAVNLYRENAAKATEIDRLSTTKEKTGQFTGAYCIHPVSGKRIPIWIADYCLASYGTGAVMGVPAHDERDFDFAKKYDLPINRVIKSSDGLPDELPYTEYGTICNSGEFDGLSTAEGKKKILEFLNKKGLGSEKINYRLRDWSVSRQRYWGAPIPVIHCEHCGAVPVPEKDLPVLLPYNVNFTPDGKSPLGKSEEFLNTTCPVCGGKAKRDPDTLDTFVCSSWYFLRYPDNKNTEKAFDTEWIDKMLPVDKYVGGAEHTCMHLLYSRFITKALRDMGYLHFDEPFKSLIHQGMILGSDGEKMSKSKGNVVNPDEYIEKYGSDVFRLYVMFGFSFTDGGPWNDDGLKAIDRFLDRIERIADKVISVKSESGAYGDAERELDYALNYCIKHVNADIQTFSFNTAIARIMELVNAIYKYDSVKPDYSFLKKVLFETVKVIAPFAPHFAEELHERLGAKNSVFKEKYPQCDESKLVKQQVEIAVQINSKIRSKLIVPTGISNEEIASIALENNTVKELLGGKAIKKTIVIPGRLINFII